MCRRRTSAALSGNSLLSGTTGGQGAPSEGVVAHAASKVVATARTAASFRARLLQQPLAHPLLRRLQLPRDAPRPFAQIDIAAE